MPERQQKPVITPSHTSSSQRKIEPAPSEGREAAEIDIPELPSDRQSVRSEIITTQRKFQRDPNKDYLFEPDKAQVHEMHKNLNDFKKRLPDAE